MKLSPEELTQITIKQDIVERAKNSPDGYYGDISDIDIMQWDHEQLNVLSLGRGNCPYIGNIDKIDPNKFSAESMFIVGSLSPSEIPAAIQFLNKKALPGVNNDIDTLLRAYRAHVAKIEAKAKGTNVVILPAH